MREPRERWRCRRGGGRQPHDCVHKTVTPCSQGLMHTRPVTNSAVLAAQGRREAGRQAAALWKPAARRTVGRRAGAARAQTGKSLMCR